LLLLRAERKLLAQDLDGSRHGSQRIANLVGDARCHLAHRGEPLLEPHVAFELFELGHVLEGDQVTRATARRLEVCRTEANLDVRPVWPSVRDLEPARTAAAQP